MANLDAAFGLKPINNFDGRPCNFAVRKYYIPATDATAVFIGDPVTKVGTANATVVNSGTEEHAIGTLMTVARTVVGDGNAITGVVVGVEASPTARNTSYRAASTERVVLVCDDPMALFEIQADGVLAVTDVGLNAVLIATNSGSTVTGLSGIELDTSSDVPAADASNQLTIVGISKVARRNDPSAANVVAVVRINQHTEASGAIGIA